MKSITELRDEQASRILDALEECAEMPITIGRTLDGHAFARNATDRIIGTSFRDALAKLLQTTT